MNNTNNNETIADIIREMRGAWDAATPTAEDLAIYADRIEAAAVRERCNLEQERRSYEKLHDCFWDRNAIQNIVRQMLGARDDLRRVSPSEADNLQYYAHELMRVARNTTGNNAAMREALIVVYDWILKAGYVHGYPDTEQKRRQLYDMMTKALSAPAAPDRNCDVGTAREQEKRFDAFVQDRRGDLNCTGKCPAHNGVDFGVVACVLQWEQMPYEEGDSDANAKA